MPVAEFAHIYAACNGKYVDNLDSKGESWKSMSIRELWATYHGKYREYRREFWETRQQELLQDMVNLLCMIHDRHGRSSGPPTQTGGQSADC